MDKEADVISLLDVVNLLKRFFAPIPLPPEISMMDEKSASLFTGVQKPTTALAHLIATKMVQSSAKMEKRAVDRYERGMDDIVWSLSFPEVSVNIGVYSQTDQNNKSKWKACDVVVKHGTDKTKSLSFSSDEYEIIARAAWRCIDLFDQKTKIEAEAEKQQQAIDVIADFFGVKENVND